MDASISSERLRSRFKFGFIRGREEGSGSFFENSLKFSRPSLSSCSYELRDPILMF